MFSLGRGGNTPRIWAEIEHFHAPSHRFQESIPGVAPRIVQLETEELGPWLLGGVCINPSFF